MESEGSALTVDLEFWHWWILSMVTINTVINSIVFIVGRKFKKVKKKQEEEGVRRGRETAEYLKSLGREKKTNEAAR